MPLLIKRGYVFIHIPKCAGTSIIETFKDECVFYGRRGYINDHSPQHSTFAELQMMNMIPEGFKIFTVCRNPYERLQSELAWRGISPENQDEFVQDFFYPKPLSRQNKDNHHLPQLEFIKGCLNSCKVLRFENINEDFLNMFGVTLAYKNQSENKQDLTKASLYLVREFWHEDFIFFGYDFKP
jgi:hypothetical protein